MPAMGPSLPGSRRMDRTVKFERGRKRLDFYCPEPNGEAYVDSSTFETKESTVGFGYSGMNCIRCLSRLKESPGKCQVHWFPSKMPQQFLFLGNLCQ